MNQGKCECKLISVLQLLKCYTIFKINPAHPFNSANPPISGEIGPSHHGFHLHPPNHQPPFIQEGQVQLLHPTCMQGEL